MKKLLITLIVIVIVAGAAGGAYYYKYGKPPEPEISTVQVTRGEVAQLVAATGTVEAVTTVDVGTQVTGVIMEMYTDFNQIVKKGQKVAKIDPKTIEATIERDKANVESAQANLERQNVSLEDSKVKLKRAQDLHDRKLLTDQDLENAQVAVKTNEASMKSQEASIKQIQAQLNQDLVNLGYTDIYAPINGIVINRKVDVGQTVVSNNAATSMFQIAEDLTKMQLKASVDESDVGWLRPGQRASFTVDAFLGRTFVGTVSQVRLQPVVSQNVVTYTTIIEVPNPNLDLKPGMTASVKIEIARRENVLRIPAAATRFRPTKEIFEALNIPMPPELQQRGRGGRGQQQLAGAAQGQGGQGGGQTGNRASGAFASGGGDRGTQPADQQAMLRRNGQGQGQDQGQGQGGQQQAQQRGDRQGQRQQGQGGDRQGMGQRQQGQGGGQVAGGLGGDRGQGGQQMTPEEREKRRQDRLAQMTPEQRAQNEERMKQFQAQGGFGGGRGQGNGRQGVQGGQAGQGGRAGQGGQLAQNNQNNQNSRFGGGRGRGPASNESGPNTGITERLTGDGPKTIDALFAPLQFNDSPGRVWVYATDGKTKSLKSISIRTGISDGTNYELTAGEGIDEGMKLVSNIDTGLANTQVRPGSSPLMPGQQQRGGMGGFGGPGGGAGGRGGR